MQQGAGRGGNFFSPAELSYERHEWWIDMADTSGLRLIGLAFAIVTLVVTATTAAVVANIDAERLEVQSTLK